MIRQCVYDGVIYKDYFVDDAGNVYSKKFNRPLKYLITSKGYARVCLVAEDKSKHYILVHRLVACAFIPNIANYYPEVDHIDGDKLNNSVTNLCWVTSKGNKHNPNTIGKQVYHRGEANCMYGRKGASHPKYGIPSKPKACICIETGEQFESTMDAQRKTGINNTSISRVCNGIRHSAGGYTWKWIKGGDA